MSSFYYNRVLLKISGESLMGKKAYGIDTDMVLRVAEEVKGVVDQGIEVCLVMVAGISFGVYLAPLLAWNGPQVTTWGCWQQ